MKRVLILAVASGILSGASYAAPDVVAPATHIVIPPSGSLMLVLPGGSAIGPACTLPYADGFEMLPVGASLLDSNVVSGWCGDGSAAAMVTNLEYSGCLQAPVVNYPINTTHSNVVTFKDGGITNLVNGSGQDKVWVDVMLCANRMDQPPTSGSFSNSQISIFVDTDGYPCVYHSVLTNGTNWTPAYRQWTELNDGADAPIGTGKWVRLTVGLDYTHYGMCTVALFQVTLNGHTFTNDLAYHDISQPLSGRTGTWFVCANNSASNFGGVAFGGSGLFDDIVIRTNAPVITLANPFTCTNNGDGTCTITGYSGDGGDVVIPDSISNLTVARIGSDALYDITNLTSVTIPAGITNIGSYAFADCASLTSITVNSANSAYSSTNGVLFDKNQGTLVEYPDGRGGSYTVPGSVTNIGDGAFFGCSSLTNITIPNSVNCLGNHAFHSCTNLTRMYFQGNAPTPGSDVFTTEIGCDPVTVYYLPGTAGWGATFGSRPTVPVGYAFTASNGTVTITGYTGAGGAVMIPSTISNLLVSGIGVGAFGGTNVISIQIPETVTNIAYLALCFCTRLAAITVDANNPAYSSRDGVLFDKSGATLIQFPEGATGRYTIPASVTIIADGAVENCASLTDITMSTNVNSIGDHAFDNCRGLTNITMGNGVTHIGTAAFDQCISLTSVSIPDSVTNVGDYAFANCWGKLASVTVGRGVSSIGSGVFEWCGYLTAIYFKGNAPALMSTMFYGNGSPTIYYLPGTTNWSATFDGRPAVLWNPHTQNDASFGLGASGFGFTISGSTGLVIVTEACADLANPAWSTMGTNSLISGSSYFSDPQWTNAPCRFYRFRSP